MWAWVDPLADPTLGSGESPFLPVQPVAVSEHLRVLPSHVHEWASPARLFDGDSKIGAGNKGFQEAG